MKAETGYQAAAYLRLSRDDVHSGRDESFHSCRKDTFCYAESDSISSQRDMIASYVSRQDAMEIYDYYVDDGFSGTNFERPGFQRMMQDIRDGHVNCVIVKDLSRLGRDYIEAGRLIQKTFPAFSVRFIALTDQFDSLTADENETSLVIPVKNFVNDSYARDISGKVRSHQRLKRERGDFIGAFAVYGYRKSEENRNLLVPDAYAAGIVQKIFAWKLLGFSNHAIAGLLEENGILSPLEYKRLRGEKLQTIFSTGIKAKWSSVAVKRILTNEVYTGTLVQGKEEKINYKMKYSVRKPEAEWIRVENVHRAIISKEDFEMAGELLQADIRAEQGGKRAHRYAGLLLCGDCGKPLTRRINHCRGRERVFFICSTQNKGKGCSRHRIEEDKLEEIVLGILRQQMTLFLNQSQVSERLNKMEIPFEEAEAFERETELLRSEQEKYQSLRETLYEDYTRGLITGEDLENFGKIYLERARCLRKAACLQGEAGRKIFRAGIRAGACLERMKSTLQVTELDRLTLLTFVKRIFVYEDNRVGVELRYQNPFMSHR